MLTDGEVVLKKGRIVELTSESVPGTVDRIPVDFKTLYKEVTAGETILLDEGNIRLIVLSVSRRQAMCRVEEGGRLLSRKGVNLPGIPLSLPSLTGKDKRDLEFAIKMRLEYVALSFVRRAEDVKAVKRIIAKSGSDIQVIAKLEKPQAIVNLEPILDIADGVMVARGDLGVEMSLAEVPVIQKKIIRCANESRVPVITATQMLETMTENPRPTRAEASDVANAIFDGTDAVMLSGETAIGKYPVKSVQMMARIIKSTEKHLTEEQYRRRRLTGEKLRFEDAISDSTPAIANAVKARLIVAFTQSGATAKLISKCRTSTHVAAFTPYEEVACRMNLYWGVRPYVLPFIENVDEVIDVVINSLKKKREVKRGDNIVFLMGIPAAEKGTTNLIKLHCVQ